MKPPPITREQEFARWLAYSRTVEKQHRKALRENPPGGSFYLPHVVQVHSGRYWRCAHGANAFWSRGCCRCALRRPLLAMRWHLLPLLRRGAMALDEGVAHPDTIAGRAVVEMPGDESMLVLWLRLPSFDFVQDYQRRTWGMRQRVLQWDDRNGWALSWR